MYENKTQRIEDRIDRNRENRAFCKERGIRISGPPLRRPPANVSPEKKKQALEDEKIRNAIEGKFGVSKRRFSLNRIMAKLPHTSLASYCYHFFGHESFYLATAGFLSFFVQYTLITLFLSATINSAYDCGIINNKSSLLFKD
jgi:hypothetical protein